MDSPVKCVCCGQALPRTDTIFVDESRRAVYYREHWTYLTPKQFALFETAKVAGQEGLVIERFIYAVYGNDASGGALTANKTVYVLINQANKRLQHTRLSIKALNNPGTWRNRYGLTRLDG